MIAVLIFGLAILAPVAVLFPWLTWQNWSQFDRFDKFAWPCMVLMILAAGFFTAQKLLQLL
jgi:hypothetical protein